MVLLGMHMFRSIRSVAFVVIILLIVILIISFQSTKESPQEAANYLISLHELGGLKDVSTDGPTSDYFESKGITTDLGEVITGEEIAFYDITVFPNGKNLPVGEGSVKQGRELYNNQCFMCHGESGIEGPAARLAGDDGWGSISDPLRILRIKKYPVLLISVGGLWPHATSIFDYIRRAMPHYAPKSLTNNESYALTAYVLYLNNYVEDSAVLDKTSILSVEMPAQKRNYIAPLIKQP